MDPIEIATLIALVFLAVFHAYAAAFTSWHVSKSAYFEPKQKYAQYAIIWLLPIIGTAIVLHVLSPEVRHRRPGWIPWIDFLLIAAFVSSASSAIEDATTHAVANHTAPPIPDGGGDD
jgi:hypothetical protein